LDDIEGIAAAKEALYNEFYWMLKTESGWTFDAVKKLLTSQRRWFISREEKYRAEIEKRMNEARKK
jgi:hypothetical protein